MSQGIDPSSYPSGDQQGQSQQQQLRRLTADEMRALRECSRESFYYRSLPFAAVGAIAVRYLGSMGYLKPSPIYGMYMKYTAAVIIGYFVGKFSYLGKCREKLMNLPNSALAEALRKSEGGGKRQLEMFQEMVTLPEISSGGAGDEHGYAPVRESSDMYTSPEFSVSGQTSAGAQSSAQDQSAQKQTTNYDELRRKNREEYLRRQFGVGDGPSAATNQEQQKPVSPPSSGAEQRSRFVYEAPQQSQQPATGTKYGDQGFK